MTPVVEMLFHTALSAGLLLPVWQSAGQPAGIWANKIQTPWNGDYHTNINLQMNYAG
jgi:hypothetical protein